jgi:HPt (histidine-containing phosphotransfer) domain-containing protein
MGTYCRLITRFVQSHGSDAQRIRQAVSDDAWEKIQGIAHVLKSTAGSIGALQLAATASRIQALNSAESVQQKELLGSQLAQEVELLHKDLERALNQLPQPVTPSEPGVLCVERLPALHAELLQYLNDRDITAVRFVREHEACLRENLGDNATPLIEAIRRFDYDQALQMMRHVKS